MTLSFLRMPMVSLMLFVPLFWTRRTVMSFLFLMSFFRSWSTSSLLPLFLYSFIKSLLFPFFFQNLVSSLFQILSSISIPKFSYWLRKVNMNSSFINEYSIHSLIGSNARLFCFKFNEGILERIPCLPISYHFTTFNWTKSREN